MKLTDCYLEEDLFPKIFADYEERPYGILFYSTNNKDSYDSNHAVIYKDKIANLVDKWSDEIENVFLETEEPWEIKVAKTSLEKPGYWIFAVRSKEKVIGLLYGHISERACRVDYLLVSKKHRRMGAGRALFYEYVEWCKQNDIKNIYI